MLLFFATTCPSEEIDECWLFLAGALLLFSVVAALASFVLGCLTSRVRVCQRLLLAVLVASVFPIAFVAHVHEIDFIPAGHEGSSGPLWKALLAPSLPLIVAALAFGAAHVRLLLAGRQQGSQP